MKLSSAAAIMSLLPNILTAVQVDTSIIEAHHLSSSVHDPKPKYSRITTNKAQVFTSGSDVRNEADTYCSNPGAYNTAQYGDIKEWDVSAVTSMVGVLGRKSCNPDISAWDVSKVTSFEDMFIHNPTFNQDISVWDTSSSTKFRAMFYGASSFNQDISHWATSLVHGDPHWGYMFRYATSFNQNLSCWPSEAKEATHFCTNSNCNLDSSYCPPPPNAGGGGDPHFHAFGGIFFSWQGICDIILIKSPNMGGEELELSVHVRTRRVRSWSAVDVVAVQLGEDVVEIGSGDGKLFINGEESDRKKFEAFSIMKSFHLTRKNVVLYNFDFGNKRKLEVEANMRTEMLYITLVGVYPRGTVGLLGSPHSPGMFARNGTNMTGMDVNTFSETWQVGKGDPKLFRRMEAPQYPSKCCYSQGCNRLSKKKNIVHGRRLKEVQQISMEEAVTACAVHQFGALKKFCIEDVFSTGDIELATDPFYELTNMDVITTK